MSENTQKNTKNNNKKTQKTKINEEYFVEVPFGILSEAVDVKETDDGFVKVSVNLTNEGGQLQYYYREGKYRQRVVTKPYMRLVKKNFDEDTNDIPYYFTHSLAIREKYDGEAQGWAMECNLRTKKGRAGLWLESEFPKEVYNRIKNKKFKYVSGEFYFANEQEQNQFVSGEEGVWPSKLLAVALGNEPRNRSMTEIERKMENIMFIEQPEITENTTQQTTEEETTEEENNNENNEESQKEENITEEESQKEVQNSQQEDVMAEVTLEMLQERFDKLEKENEELKSSTSDLEKELSEANNKLSETDAKEMVAKHIARGAIDEDVGEEYLEELLKEDNVAEAIDKLDNTLSKLPSTKEKETETKETKENTQITETKINSNESVFANFLPTAQDVKGEDVTEDDMATIDTDTMFAIDKDFFEMVNEGIKTMFSQEYEDDEMRGLRFGHSPVIGGEPVRIFESVMGKLQAKYGSAMLTQYENNGKFHEDMEASQGGLGCIVDETTIFKKDLVQGEIQYTGV